MLELLSRETKAHMNKFYVLVGSNINPEANIKAGLSKIHAHPDINIIKKSSHYESEPYGMEGNNFINLVILMESANDFSEVEETLKHIELQCGRVRDPNNKFTSRTLDLDIIDWNGFEGEINEKQFPDPEIKKRTFVAIPYFELKNQS